MARGARPCAPELDDELAGRTGRMSARLQSLALKAALFAMVAWVVGMTLAVITEHPLI